MAEREPVRVTLLVDADQAEKFAITPGEWDVLFTRWQPEDGGRGAYFRGAVYRKEREVI